MARARFVASLTPNLHQKTTMSPRGPSCLRAAAVSLLLLCGGALLTSAILVQPYNYMLDDSSLINSNQADSSGSLSPFYHDQGGSSESGADKDIISIIGDRLARLRFARMLNEEAAAGSSAGHLSQEMADLMSQTGEQAASANKDEQSLSASVASMLMNVAQAAATGASGGEEASESAGSQTSNSQPEASMSARGGIMELDTTAHSSSGSAPSKADLKTETRQWFNPKETIPVLKISSMATPSKYKKVYFRSEKKLVDGAFHSTNSEQEEKKSSLMKPFNSGVQRRSSRGTSSSVAPPSVLQDGVIDFFKKFRDVYIQTRPAANSPSPSGSAGSSVANFASNLFAASASSPLASIIAPPSAGGSRPNLAGALSAASSMVAQAAGAAPSGAASAGAASAATSTGATSSNPIRSPLTAQAYVSFWSKTFPDWVRKMLKQLRRRSLQNSNKRYLQNQQHQHSAAASIGQAAQAAASSAVASVVEQATSGSASGSSSSSSTGH